MDITNIAHLVSAVRKVQSLKVKVHILQIVIFFFKEQKSCFHKSYSNPLLWNLPQLLL